MSIFPQSHVSPELPVNVAERNVALLRLDPTNTLHIASLSGPTAGLAAVTLTPAATTCQCSRVRVGPMLATPFPLPSRTTLAKICVNGCGWLGILLLLLPEQ